MTDKLERPDLEQRARLDTIISSLNDLHSRILTEIDRGWRKFQPRLNVSLLEANVVLNATVELERYKEALASVPEQDSLGEREAIVAWLDDHLKAGACLSLSWIIDAIEAGEHLSTRQALEQGSGHG